MCHLAWVTVSLGLVLGKCWRRTFIGAGSELNLRQNCEGDDGDKFQVYTVKHQGILSTPCYLPMTRSNAKLTSWEDLNWLISIPPKLHLHTCPPPYKERHKLDKEKGNEKARRRANTHNAMRSRQSAFQRYPEVSVCHLDCHWYLLLDHPGYTIRWFRHVRSRDRSHWSTVDITAPQFQRIFAISGRSNSADGAYSRTSL
jgi:hypothetical protein